MGRGRWCGSTGLGLWWWCVAKWWEGTNERTPSVVALVSCPSSFHAHRPPPESPCPSLHVATISPRTHLPRGRPMRESCSSHCLASSRVGARMMTAGALCTVRGWMDGCGQGVCVCVYLNVSKGGIILSFEKETKRPRTRLRTYIHRRIQRGDIHPSTSANNRSTHRPRAFLVPSSARFFATSSRMGRPKASVLPVPVRERPIGVGGGGSRVSAGAWMRTHIRTCTHSKANATAKPRAKGCLSPSLVPHAHTRVRVHPQT